MNVHDANNTALVDGTYAIGDLIDMNRVRRIFEKFTNATGFTIGFLDHPGLNILIATGWRDICLRFHRSCPAARGNCTRSNRRLLDQLDEPGKLAVDLCDNGLVDCATPIIVKGKHIASLATGQILFEKPHLERFRRQARLFGFDENEYLKSLEDVPVVSEETLRKVTAFLGEIALMISELGYTNLLMKGQAARLENELAERRCTEEALRESERRYRLLADNVSDVIWVRDMGLRLTYVSPSVSRITGYSAEEAVAVPLEKSYTPASLAAAQRAFAEELAMETMPDKDPNRTRTLELEGYCKDGTTRWIEAGITFLRGEDGRPVGILGVSRDMTWRKRAENALKETKELFQALVERSPLGISIIDKNGLYKYVNPRFVEIFGYTLDEISTGKEWFRRVFPDPTYRNQAMEAWVNDLKETGRIASVQPRSFRVTCKDGSEKMVLFRPVAMETGDRFVLHEDITLQRSLEAQLLHSQKMEAVGTLAGGIAHDFNNLLQAIMGFTQILLMKKTQDDPDFKRLQRVEKAAGRAGVLTRQLLTFSRKVESKLRPVDLNQEIMHMGRLLKSTIPKMIAIEYQLEETLNRVNADPTQIEQVLMNLCINARDAMPEGGKLVISTENTTLHEDYCKAHLDVVPGEYVLLTLSDTGHGMDKMVLERIYDPFFTTKAPGMGTGLGLPMVYGIVKSHGGHILCSSEPGKGTTFRVYLPAIEPGTIDQESMREEESIIPGGDETILLVEDEDFLRDLGKEMLERFGYKVLLADTGERALDVYQQAKESISLVILDLIMPGMGGKKCLEELLRLDPLVKVVMASGFSMEGTTREALEAGARGFVGKPYDLRQMLKVVREVLNDAPTSLQ